MCGLGLALYAQGSVEHWGGGLEGETMKAIYLTSCKPRFPFPWTYEAYQADLQLKGLNAVLHQRSTSPLGAARPQNKPKNVIQVPRTTTLLPLLTSSLM